MRFTTLNFVLRVGFKMRKWIREIPGRCAVCGLRNSVVEIWFRIFWAVCWGRRNIEDENMGGSLPIVANCLAAGLEFRNSSTCRGPTPSDRHLCCWYDQPNGKVERTSSSVTSMHWSVLYFAEVDQVCKWTLGKTRRVEAGRALLKNQALSNARFQISMRKKGQRDDVAKLFRMPKYKCHSITNFIQSYHITEGELVYYSC